MQANKLLKGADTNAWNEFSLDSYMLFINEFCIKLLISKGRRDIDLLYNEERFQ